MDREAGIKEIVETDWERIDGPIEHHYQIMFHDEQDRENYFFLDKRPPYCDRGHYYLRHDTYLHIDYQDGFPRYFFSLYEADMHVRRFALWRIWKHRTVREEFDFKEAILKIDPDTIKVTENSMITCKEQL